MADYKKKVASSTKLIRVLSVILKNKQKQKLKQYCSLYRIFKAERFLGHAMMPTIIQTFYTWRNLTKFEKEQEETVECVKGM